jgi:hypothetical protein
MQSSRTSTGKAVLALAVMLCAVALTAQTGRQLYLVTGLRTPTDELRVSRKKGPKHRQMLGDLGGVFR